METGRRAHLPGEDDATNLEQESHRLPPPKARQSERGDAVHAHRKKGPQAEPTGLLALNDCARDGPNRETRRTSVHAVDVTRPPMAHHDVGDVEEAKRVTRKETPLNPQIPLVEDGCETVSRSRPTMNNPTDKGPRTSLVVTLDSLTRPRCR